MPTLNPLDWFRPVEIHVRGPNGERIVIAESMSPARRWLLTQELRLSRLLARIRRGVA